MVYLVHIYFGIWVGLVGLGLIFHFQDSGRRESHVAWTTTALQQPILRIHRVLYFLRRRNFYRIV